jgi:cell division septation protein DedD
MKTFALAAALSFFFIACEDSDDIPLPPLPPVSTPDAEESETPPDEPKPQEVSKAAPEQPKPKPEQPKPKPEKPKPEPPKPKPEPPKPAAKQTAVLPLDNSGQLNSGRYTIQVAVLPSETSAKAIVKKLASNGIKAYTVKVSNPAKLMGSYHRVRIGYFNEKTAAENFARSNISPLGYDWWIDRSSNER